jgi:hypothetical protein
MTDETNDLLRRLIGGHEDAGNEILARAWTGNAPSLLVAAALLAEDHRGLLRRATKHAVTTRDRQLVAIAAAHFDHDEDRLDALVRDHLSDHPDNILAAWIAAKHSRSGQPATSHC